MPTRDNYISFAVSEHEKNAIREAAAARGETMATYVRDLVLDGVVVEEPNREPDAYTPFEDFINSRFLIDEGADPIPKQEAYERYVAFCGEQYPEHSIESQHKFTRDLGDSEIVEQGRAYVDGEQRRCFFNLAWKTNPKLQIE